MPEPEPPVAPRLNLPKALAFLVLVVAPLLTLGGVLGFFEGVLLTVLALALFL